MLRDIISVIGSVIGFLGIVVSVLTLLAIVAAAVVYYFQLKEMQKSTTAAKKSSDAAEAAVKQTEANVRLDQRAWIALSNITGVPKEGELFRPKVFFQNTGRTFAKNTHLAACGDFVDPDKLPDFAERLETSDEKKRAAGKKVRALVPPNGNTHDTLEPPSEENRQTKDTIEGLQKGRMKFFIYGQVTYDDVFNQSHWFIFCSTLEYNPREPNENDKWFYGVYDRFNDTGDGQIHSDVWKH